MNDLQASQLAVVGMDARFGDFRSLDDFANSLYDATQQFALAEPVTAAALLMTVVEGALTDARLSSVVPLIVAGLPVDAVNWAGPVYAAPEGENAVFAALETAQMLLNAGKAEAIVIGAAALAQDVKDALTARYGPPPEQGAPALSFDTHAQGWIAGEGAGAVVLKRRDQAARNRNRIYAVIESTHLGGDAAVAQTCRAALDKAGLQPDAIGYLEVSGSGSAPQDEAEMAGLLAVYRADKPDLTCALGSVKANVGHTGDAAGVASLIKTALCLYHRFIPAMPKWTGPRNPESWTRSPFYVATKSKTWFLEPGTPRRIAAINGPGAHVILSEDPDQCERPNTYLQQSGFYLFLLAGDDVPSLTERLDALDRAVRNWPSLREVAAKFFAASRDKQAAYTLAIIGHTKDELIREIQHARKGVQEAIESKGEWSTPLGSYFTANPLGDKGKVAFVYPGAFSSYPKMGQDLFHLFPYLHGDLLDSTSDLARSVGDRWLYARTLEKQSTRQWKLFRQNLEDHPAAMMESGIASAIIFTRIVRDFFRLKPDMAMGYSLGEGSMLWGMGVWMDGDAGNLMLENSPVLKDRLFGPKNTIREMWGLPPETPDDFWSVYFVAATPEAVTAALQSESQVYLTHTNTPNEVAIAGETEACKRVVAALKCDHLHAPFSMVIHCEPTISEYEHFFRLHNYPVRNRPDVAFYSAADYQTMRLDQTMIAHCVSRTACKMLDFPRLINRVYNDGARIFIEIGPRSTCARWISETLSAREHLSVSVNHLGVDDKLALLRMLARLVSHGVAIDVAPLYEQIQESAPVQPAQVPPLENVNQAHSAFLQSRLEALRQMGEVLQMQMSLLSQGAGSPVETPVSASAPIIPAFKRSPAVFDEKAIQEFATGSVVACFGPEYAIYEHRRAPRIPNGDLLLVSRVIEINGERHKLAPNSRIVSEYDMPADPWFFRDNARPGIPYSIYMEMALQLCGFLSAYLGSTLIFPELDFFFRNLDGQGTLYRDDDLRGKTITNTVHLTSSITLEGIILQKFTFQLAADGEVFYEGDASFGCFTAQAMLNQTGLDKGKPTLPWYKQQNLPNLPDLQERFESRPGKPHYRLSQRQLDFLDEYLIIPDSGRYGKGYVYASENLDPTDWFYYCHFYQDPVMPGSLGVEAILQALQAFALDRDLGKQFESPHFEQVLNRQIVWRYRGQVLRSNKQIYLEIHISDVQITPEQVTITGDASLWRDDGLRIYEVLGVALCITETQQ